MFELRRPSGEILDLVEEQERCAAVGGRAVERLAEHFACVPVNQLHDRCSQRLQIAEIIELEPEQALGVDAVADQLVDDLGQHSCLANLTGAPQDDRRRQPPRQAEIDGLECPAAKRGKRGDRLAEPPGISVPDDCFQPAAQNLKK